MTISDLVFLACLLCVIVMLVRIAAAALARDRRALSSRSRLLGMFLAVYALALIALALTMPRRYFAPGERYCFDDWCVTATSAAPAPDPADPSCNWIANLEVSSVARRVRQRAPDAHADLEDAQGRRYRPCSASANGNLMSDPLDPGDSFPVQLRFRLPPGATPAGIVVHHGEFPGLAVAGSDQSFLHPPALQRVAVEHRP